DRHTRQGVRHARGAGAAGGDRGRPRARPVPPIRGLLRRVVPHVLSGRRVPDRGPRCEDGRDRGDALLHLRLAVRSVEAHRPPDRCREGARGHVLARQWAGEAVPHAVHDLRAAL
ncbi:MAG: FIG00450153: hypothetical protein, partial [uncultured Rubellimicrobium sp.]